MKNYKHILVATDLTEESHPVTERAIQVATQSDAQVTLFHVVMPISTYAYMAIDVNEIEESLVKTAKDNMQKLAAEYNIPASKQLVEVGPPKYLIVEKAKELNVDLVIVGSHTRHGLEKLLGSTAAGVINNAHCDVLTVRYKTHS